MGFIGGRLIGTINSPVSQFSRSCCSGIDDSVGLFVSAHWDCLGGLSHAKITFHGKIIDDLHLGVGE